MTTGYLKNINNRQSQWSDSPSDHCLDSDAAKTSTTASTSTSGQERLLRGRIGNIEGVRTGHRNQPTVVAFSDMRFPMSLALCLSNAKTDSNGS